jgi:hypothetical protein
MHYTEEQKEHWRQFVRDLVAEIIASERKRREFAAALSAGPGGELWSAWRRAVTFDELFAHHALTPDERAALVHHLASLRYRRTVERLLLKLGVNPLPDP